MEILTGGARPYRYHAVVMTLDSGVTYVLASGIARQADAAAVAGGVADGTIRWADVDAADEIHPVDRFGNMTALARLCRCEQTLLALRGGRTFTDYAVAEAHMLNLVQTRVGGRLTALDRALVPYLHLDCSHLDGNHPDTPAD